ncbi:CidA/LrgA family protein [Chitinasiproducens palmae]|uniref:Holin-like protein n=1 Tax=Chitinasiproducens palmae TaxID=1770053 RepID=A0A1H2PPJ0_9BURK|nr:CidA/LrgA family protein [Chitinasiproducens palmae]SDV48669.1 holin-like protein [Chitinasiproducens palmae]
MRSLLKNPLAFDLRALWQSLLLVLVFVGVSQILQWSGVGAGAAPFGFLLMLLALVCRIVPLSVFERGARWLLAQSALFFIPPVVSIARQRDVLQADWLPLLIVVVGGTVLTAVMTALSVETACRILTRRRA